MNHEQFFYWVQGYAESSPDTFWSKSIVKKAKEVNVGFAPTNPIVPIQYTELDDIDELDSFMNLDNIPIEEELPAVGSDIDTEAEWVPSKGNDVRDVHGVLDKESGIDTSGEWDKADSE